MAEIVTGIVSERRAWTDELFSLFIDAEIQPFHAGQFIRVGIEVDGEQLFRPYSLLNAVSTQPLEILFNIIPEGPLTPRLAEMHLEERLLIDTRPRGLLTLESIPEQRDLWLFATGTGIGPYLSILRSGEVWQRTRRVVLVHSVRFAAELVYRDLLDQLAGEHAGQFHYLPSVTREAVPGAFGARIPLLVESGELEARSGVPLGADGSHAMLCGNAAMIAACCELLDARGMRRHTHANPGHVSLEKYH